MALISARKAGRCFNGAHRDAGRIIHLVEEMPENTNGDWMNPALCGTKPGLRGYGWTKSDKDATCEKCRKKNTKLIK